MTTSSIDILHRDLHCARCQYNLRGLAIDSVCPECGHPIRHSLLQRPTFSHSDAVNIRSVCVLGICSIFGAYAYAKAEEYRHEHYHPGRTSLAVDVGMLALRMFPVIAMNWAVFVATRTPETRYRLRGARWLFRVMAVLAVFFCWFALPSWLVQQLRFRGFESQWAAALVASIGLSFYIAAKLRHVRRGLAIDWLLLALFESALAVYAYLRYRDFFPLFSFRSAGDEFIPGIGWPWALRNFWYWCYWQAGYRSHLRDWPKGMLAATVVASFSALTMTVTLATLIRRRGVFSVDPDVSQTPER